MCLYICDIEIYKKKKHVHPNTASLVFINNPHNEYILLTEMFKLLIGNVKYFFSDLCWVFFMFIICYSLLHCAYICLCISNIGGL